jgi:hypothetical protein
LLAARLHRFQNCYTPEPLLLNGIFLKKMPHFAPLKRAREFWNRSSFNGEFALHTTDLC